MFKKPAQESPKTDALRRHQSPLLLLLFYQLGAQSILVFLIHYEFESFMRFLTLTMLFFGFVFSLTTQAQPLNALQTPLVLEQEGNYSLGLHSIWLEDSELSLTPQLALESNQWQQSNTEYLNFGFSSSAYWLATKVTTSEPRQWALWNKYALIDLTEVWTCPLPMVGIENCEYQQIGDQLPFSLRQHDHPTLILTLPLQAHTDYLLLMRLNTQGTYQLPMSLVDTTSLHSEIYTNNIWRGFYYGILLVMGLYNLFIFFSMRDRSYLYYSGFALSFLMFHMVYEGSAFQYFWPELPKINNYALPIFFALNMLSLTFFVPSFLNLKENNNSLFRLFRGYSALVLVSVIMLPLLHYQLLVPLYNTLSIVISCTALITGVYFWSKGIASARFFTIAWLAFLIGLVMANARSLGLIPTNNVTLYAYQIGSFVEVLLLALALSERIIRLQNEQQQARQELVISQAEAIKHLQSYEDLYQNSLTGKFQLNRDGYFIKSNASWRQILGYTDEDYFLDDNPRFNDLFSDSKQRQQFWQSIKGQNQLQAFVASFTQPTTGERVMVSMTIRKSNTDNVEWFGAGQDVTESHLKEQALIQLQKEKAQSLRQLVMGIAKQMESPLSEIHTAENYLKNNSPNISEEERKREIKQGIWYIEQGGSRLTELNKLMKNAVIEADKYIADEIRIREWLTAWQEEQQEQHEKLQLRTAVHSYIVDWLVYPEALTIVLNQLVKNSCEHNAELLDEGNLKVSVEIRERSEFIELHYYDNGVGISAEEQGLIFMPFYTSKPESADNKGLGLYQTYNLLTELMQGYIEWPETTEGFAMIVKFHLTTPVLSKNKTQEVGLDDSQTKLNPENNEAEY